MGSGEELNLIDQELVNKMPKVSYMGIPGGIDTQQKHCRIDHDEEANFDMITGNFVLQPVEKMNNQLIKMTNSKTVPEILNVECFNEYSKTHISQLDEKEDFVKLNIFFLQRAQILKSLFVEINIEHYILVLIFVIIFFSLFPLLFNIKVIKFLLFCSKKKKKCKCLKNQTFTKRKIPLRRSLSSMASFSSSQSSQLLTPPDTSTTEVHLAGSSPTADPLLILQHETASEIPLLKKKDHRYKKPVRKTTSRKLSSSNVDEYMANMSKIGEEIAAAGQSIATVLSRSIPSENLLFKSIAETLTRIATSTESFANSAKRIACSLEKIAAADAENKELNL